MSFAPAKALVPLLLSLLCFNVFCEIAEPLPAQPPLHHHHPTLSPVSETPSHHYGHAPSIAPVHHRHHHGHPPTHAPVPTPTHAPVHPPTHAPSHTPPHAPVHPPKPHTPPPAPAHPHHHPPAHPPSTYHLPRKLVAVQGVVYCKSCKYVGVDTLLGATPVAGATVKLVCNNTKHPTELKITSDNNGYFLLKAPGTITNYGAHKCKAFLVSSPNTACSKISNLHGGFSGAILRPEKKPYFDEKKHEFALYSVGPFAFEPKCPH